MKIITDIPDNVVEEIVKSIMENFPEASSGSALVCTGWKYDKWKFTFVDTENDDKEYTLDKAKLLATFPLIFDNTKWPKGCTQPIFSIKIEDWNDWLCQADAQDFDAFAQLACLGECVYG